MENILKVTTSELRTSASTFSTEATTVKGLHDQMLNLVKGLNSSWTGDAATAYQNKFAALQDSMNTLNRMILEHSKDVEAIADEFDEAESKASSLAGELAQSSLA